MCQQLFVSNPMLMWCTSILCVCDLCMQLCKKLCMQPCMQPFVKMKCEKTATGVAEREWLAELRVLPCFLTQCPVSYTHALKGS